VNKLGFIIPIVAILMALSGCGLMNVKTEIKDPDGRVWEISSKSDALVQIKTKDTEIITDNRGRPGTLETIMGLALTKTNINLGLSNQPGEE